jgi:hypothetical protein
MRRERGQQSMATIRATCGDCGDVELTSADVGVRVCTDDASGTYLFRCPHCRTITVKPAEPHVVDLLVAAGVTLSTWRLPAELHERPGGAPITHDDLLDFHLLLEDESWFERLATVSGD